MHCTAVYCSAHCRLYLCEYQSVPAPRGDILDSLAGGEDDLLGQGRVGVLQAPQAQLPVAGGPPAVHGSQHYPRLPGGLAVHSSLVGGSVQDSGVLVFTAGL